MPVPSTDDLKRALRRALACQYDDLRFEERGDDLVVVFLPLGFAFAIDIVPQGLACANCRRRFVPESPGRQAGTDHYCDTCGREAAVRAATHRYRQRQQAGQTA